LFEELPEAGDLPKPKLVFFFDEAHLLFNDAPKALMDKIEQVVRLIRSKGVGVYFVTQNPVDVPDKVLAQLGNRVQHALRAFTPRDQKAVAAAAQTFRPNPKLDTARVIMELAKGEALASFLEGGEFPVPIAQPGANGTVTLTIQFREFGIRLNFVPEIVSDSLIKLSVRPEVSSLDFANGVNISGFRIPALRTRRASTTVDVKRDQSLIISGLFSEDRQRTRTGIPILSEIIAKRWD
jgi:hypothetical protein